MDAKSVVKKEKRRKAEACDASQPCEPEEVAVAVEPEPLKKAKVLETTEPEAKPMVESPSKSGESSFSPMKKPWRVPGSSKEALFMKLSDEILVKVCVFKDQHYVDLRKVYAPVDGSDGVIYTKKGITMNVS